MLDLKRSLAFLTELEKNNNREWYHAHKKERDLALREFEKLLQILIDELSILDANLLYLQPKDLVFRLNRDMRFSKNQPPYKTAFSAHISPAGRFPIPTGYFISLQPNHTIIGGGLFASQFSEATSLIRDYLDSHSKEFLALVQDEDFSKNFTVIGDKLKNVPRSYDKDHILAEYLKHKAWAIEYPLSDQQLASADKACKTIVQKFKLMKPFNDYLNRALVTFKRPEQGGRK